ncbi:MAG: MFS transporter [Acidimicrobiia bacterium]|nr:MFS transporter [Acidimicrobiia bacterium]
METGLRAAVPGASRLADARLLYWSNFFVSGAALTLIGPALAELRDRTGTDVGQIGVLFVGQALGGVCGSLVAGLLVDRFNGHRVYAAAAVVMAAGQVVIPWLRSVPLLVAAFAVVGAGSLAVSTCTNALLVRRRDSSIGRGLSILHLCFGLGAIFAPLMAYLSVNLAFWSSAVAVAALGLTALRLPTPAPAESGTEHMNTTLTVMVLAAAFYWVYVGIELGFAGWLATYGLAVGFDPAAVAWLNSGFWIAFTAGRALVSLPRRELVPRSVVATGLGLLLAGAVVLVAGNGAAVAVWWGTVLVGLAVAPQFPMMMTYLDRRILLTGRFTSLMLAGAAAGNLTAPWLIGQWIHVSGAPALAWAVLVMAATLTAVFLMLDQVLGGSSRPRFMRREPL